MRRVACPECKKEMIPPKLDSHRQHSCEHGSKTSIAYIACNECGRMLSGSTLDNHQKYGCSFGPKIRNACPKCERRIRPDCLQNHDLLFHQKFYKCLEPGCSSAVRGKLYSEPALKLHHSFLHEEAIHGCLEAECEAKSKKKYTEKGLQDHNKAIHMGEVIDCTKEYCDFITKYASELDRHVYKCHKGTAAYENVMARRSNAHAVAMFSERTTRKQLDFASVSGIDDVPVNANYEDNLEDSLWLSEDEKHSMIFTTERKQANLSRNVSVRLQFFATPVDSREGEACAGPILSSGRAQACHKKVILSEEYTLLQAVHLPYVPNEAQSTVLRLRTQCSLYFMLSGRVTAFLKLKVLAKPSDKTSTCTWAENCSKPRYPLSICCQQQLWLVASTDRDEVFKTRGIASRMTIFQVQELFQNTFMKLAPELVKVIHEMEIMTKVKGGLVVPDLEWDRNQVPTEATITVLSSSAYHEIADGFLLDKGDIDLNLPDDPQEYIEVLASLRAARAVNKIGLQLDRILNPDRRRLGPTSHTSKIRKARILARACGRSLTTWEDFHLVVQPVAADTVPPLALFFRHF